VNGHVRLALAIYREALGLNNIAYQFLGFSKVINVLHEKGPDQKHGSIKTVDLLQSHQARERLAHLKTIETDIGRYLYESGRCAVAHAYAEPLVDPEDPDDAERLQKDLPLIQVLAEYLIEYELGVKSAQTIWREHLYELDGFRELIGHETVRALKEKRTLDFSLLPVSPSLSIRIRDHVSLGDFEGMMPVIDSAGGGSIVLECHSSDNLVHCFLELNFAEERLLFDAWEGVRVLDDRISSVPFQYAADQGRLMKGLALNGQLEVWDTANNKLLGRADPCCKYRPASNR
jgi:hypothetical protein